MRYSPQALSRRSYQSMPTIQRTPVQINDGTLESKCPECRKLEPMDVPGPGVQCPKVCRNCETLYMIDLSGVEGVPEAIIEQMCQVKGVA